MANTWGNIVPISESFNSGSMKIPYKGPISKQLLQRLAGNTGYLYNVAEREILILNEQFSFVDTGTEMLFDKDRDYNGQYVGITHLNDDKLGTTNVTTINIPFLPNLEGLKTWENWYYFTKNHSEAIYLLGTDYQSLIVPPTIDIKALTSGGFVLYRNGGFGTIPYSFLIRRFRRVIGTML